MASGARMRISAGLIAVTTSANALSFTRQIQLSLLRPHLGTSFSSLLSRPRLPMTTPPADNCPAHYEEYFPSPCKLRAAALGDAAGGGGGVAWQDAGAAALVVAGAYALVSAFDNLTGRNLIQQSLSRKLVHILSGLLFMASWPIFSTSIGARYFASFVPLVNCLRLLIYGLSLANDEGLVKSVTREGKPEELLRGPLYYVLILILCAILFWRDSPVGVIAVSMMCGGDGVADIMGRRFGSIKLPYNHQKSWAGSISMFVFGFLISVGMLYYFSAFGYFQLEWSSTIRRVALISLVATLVESLPTTGIVDDNISVPLASMATAFLSFGY